MLTYTEFWIFSTCLLGAVQCFLLCVYFLFLKQGNARAHRIFSALMLLIGLRLLKSGHYLFIGEDMPLIWMNIGFAAHWAVGPLSWFYLRTFLGKVISKREYIIHFLPAGLLLILAPWLGTHNFWYVGGYSLLLICTLVYFGFTLRLWWIHAPQMPSPYSKRWTSSLLFGIGVFFLAYFSNYMMRIIPYEMAPVLYSLAVLPISISAWRSYPDLTRTKAPDSGKYENLNLEEARMEVFRDRIMHYLDQERAFLDPEFDLATLARDTAIPNHLLSMTLNQYMETNFTRLVNSYRVKEACRLLHLPEKSHYTIAAVAFEAGFNSISVFNQHFKQRMGITPSAFRRTKPAS